MEEREKTTFWMDFTIAEKFGKSAIEDTFNHAFYEWKHNYKYLTELVMVLNHKLWYWYKSNDEYCKLYDKLWQIADNYAMNNLKGKELTYYLRVTD